MLIIQGIDAEKNKISETQATATTSLVPAEALATNGAGKNISAMLVARAFAARTGSGSCISHVNGTKIYPIMSKTGVYFAIISPKLPIAIKDGAKPIASFIPSSKFIFTFWGREGAEEQTFTASPKAILNLFPFTFWIEDIFLQ